MIQNLMTPRFKVVADYPNSPFKIGDVLIQHSEHTSAYWVGPICYYNREPERFISIFKPLKWWEERKPEELLSACQEWRPVVGYEGLYEVSNLSLVRSVKRKKLLIPSIRPNGYIKIALSKHGKTKTFLVHRLVALAFIENPDDKKCVNHIDNNPSNNFLENLEWVTHSENLLHAVKTNNYSQKARERFYREFAKKPPKPIKPKPEQRRSKRVKQNDMGGDTIQVYSSIMEASRSSGISKSALHRMVQSTKNLVWQYATEEEYNTYLNSK